MAELSKTAKKAMQAGDNNQPKKQTHVWTNDEMIYQIRISRPPNANLFVGNMLFVDALLTEYDKVKSELAQLTTAYEALKGDLTRTQAELSAAMSSGGQQEHTVIMDEISRA